MAHNHHLNPFYHHQKGHLAFSSLNQPAIQRFGSQVPDTLRAPIKSLPGPAQSVSSTKVHVRPEICTMLGVCEEEWAREPGTWSSPHRPAVVKDHNFITQTTNKDSELKTNCPVYMRRAMAWLWLGSSTDSPHCWVQSARLLHGSGHCPYPGPTKSFVSKRSQAPER